MFAFFGRPSRWLLAVAVAAVLVAGACGPVGPEQQQAEELQASEYKPVQGRSGGTLIYADWQGVRNLSILTSSAATTQQAGSPIFARLWWFGPDHKTVPDLVQEVPTESNGMVKQIDATRMDVTVRLRQGLKWSDGTPLTTRDVKFTWEAICDPETGATSQVGMDRITSMDIKSDTEMVWHFGPNKKGTCGLQEDLQSGLYADYLILSSDIIPMPSHALGNVPHGDWRNHPYFTERPNPTSGPYKVQSFVAGSAAQVVGVPNPNYRAGRQGVDRLRGPHLDQIIYKVYSDKATMINGAKTGDTDIGLDLVANDLPALQAVTNARTRVTQPLQDEMVLFNVGNNTKGCAAQSFDRQACGTPTPWKDQPQVRQALALAIDKKQIVDQLVEGRGKVMNGPFMENFEPWFDKSRPKFKRDVAKANQLLDDAGWTRGPGGVRTKNGRALEFTIATTTGNPQRAATQELLIKHWAEVGAKASIDNHPAAELFAGFDENGILATGQYDASMFTFIWDPGLGSWANFALIAQIPTAANPAGQNWGAWRDRELNDLFIKADRTLDVDQRRQIANDIQRRWTEYTGVVELYQRPNVTLAAPTAGNFAPGSQDLDAWNTGDWFNSGAR
jgi:peptide/nickel transport system substrate-binding protein